MQKRNQKKKTNIKNGVRKIVHSKLKRLKHAFVKIKNFSKLQFHMKSIQNFIRESFKGLNVNVLKNLKLYKEGFTKLGNSLMAGTFKEITSTMKMMKKRKRENKAMRIYRKKVIIEKNHIYKIFAKFFNRWRGKIMSKSRSVVKREFNNKIINLNQLF